MTIAAICLLTILGLLMVKLYLSLTFPSNFKQVFWTPRQLVYFFLDSIVFDFQYTE